MSYACIDSDMQLDLIAALVGRCSADELGQYLPFDPEARVAMTALAMLFCGKTPAPKKRSVFDICGRSATALTSEMNWQRRHGPTNALPSRRCRDAALVRWPPQGGQPAGSERGALFCGEQEGAGQASDLDAVTNPSRSSCATQFAGARYSRRETHNV